MEPYILLRANHEFGPFSIKELQSIGLLPTDLVWEEGESKSWQHPSEITELQHLLQQSVKGRRETSRTKLLKPLMRTPLISATDLKEQRDFTSGQEKVEINFDESFSQTGDDHHVFVSHKVSGGRMPVGSGIFAFILLLIGVALSTVIVKQMILGFQAQPSSSTAQELKEDLVSVSTSAHSATAPIRSNLPAVAAAIVSPKQTDTVAKKTRVIKNQSTASNIKNSGPVITDEPITGEKSRATEDSMPVSQSTNETTPLPKEEKKESKPIVAKPAPLQLSANDYKVGVFGGISDLELTVVNPTGETIRKTTVEVEYLKPNGYVVKSQLFSIENLSAGGSKKIAVPASSRGVKVRYHVVTDTVSEQKNDTNQ